MFSSILNFGIAPIFVLPWVNYIWAESSGGDELEYAITLADCVGFNELGG
jgi:hypothetical protein